MRKIIVLIIGFMFMFVLASCGQESKLQLKPGIDNVEINTSWTDSGAFIVIDEEEKLVYSSSVVDTTKLGIYKVQYKYEVNDEEYTAVRYVIVRDTTKPTITLNPGIDTVKLGSSWVDAGATVSDNSKENLNLKVSGSVNTNVEGIYKIKYEATDSSNNTREVVRMVRVTE